MYYMRANLLETTNSRSLVWINHRNDHGNNHLDWIRWTPFCLVVLNSLFTLLLPKQDQHEDYVSGRCRRRPFGGET
jgi:hypothetical protein